MTGSSTRPFLIGVAGGSGSGKTHFATALQARLGPEVCEIVYQDDFYFDQSGRFDFDGGAVNFDHPDSLDFQALADCLSRLKRGETAEAPVYDFATHSRRPQPQRLPPKPVILVDGILILHAESVRRLFDDTIFFATPEGLRFRRRMDRDVRQRGRTPEGVRQQFERQVKPMHDLFVEPSKAFAARVVVEMGEIDEVLADYERRLAPRRPGGA